MNGLLSFSLILGLTIAFSLIWWVLSLREVVPSNEIHVVQKYDRTVSYGKGTENGNVYYKFPTWLPYLGIRVIVLSTSVFDLDLKNYEAYDKERLPFMIDVKAFFRVDEPEVAASRVESTEELTIQLGGILQGAVRSLLAQANLEDIMSERNSYGVKFTTSVQEQLKSWGVTTVKSIELMDVRDSQGSQVIKNIMEKRKSFIEMESRKTVAENLKQAKVAEIRAEQEVAIKNEEKNLEVGLKQANVNQEVNIARETAIQKVKEQEKITADKEMEIEKVKNVRAAEIAKEATVINAQANKESITLAAEAKLFEETKVAEAIKLKGIAEADTVEAMNMAPVKAQLELAKEIGNNGDYQKYLITIKDLEVRQIVETEKAKNLANADIKIIANAGDTSTGIKSVMDVFSPKGGFALAGAVEALTSTDKGNMLFNNLLKKAKGHEKD